MQEYDLETEKFTNFSKQLERSGSWKSKTHSIRSIVFDSRNENAVLVHDDSNIIVITRDGVSRKKTETVRLWFVGSSHYDV